MHRRLVIKKHPANGSTTEVFKVLAKTDLWSIIFSMDRKSLYRGSFFFFFLAKKCLCLLSKSMVDISSPEN